jgi:hypothetical protein
MNDMEIEYSLTKDDYLIYHLYTASKSKNTIRNKRNAKYIPPVFFILIGVYLMTRDNTYTGIIMFAMLSVLWFVFYPMLQKRRYEKYYSRHIDENYVNRININTRLEIDTEYFRLINKTGESKINTSELKALIELKDYFFIELLSKQTLIIPKKNIERIEVFKENMQDYHLSFIDETMWSWR